MSFIIMFSDKFIAKIPNYENFGKVSWEEIEREETEQQRLERDELERQRLERDELEQFGKVNWEDKRVWHKDEIQWYKDEIQTAREELEKARKELDEHRPQGMTGMSLFMEEQTNLVREKWLKSGDLSSYCDELRSVPSKWGALSPSEREPYIKMANKSRNEYYEKHSAMSKDELRMIFNKLRQNLKDKTGIKDALVRKYNSLLGYNE